MILVVSHCSTAVDIMIFMSVYVVEYSLLSRELVRRNSSSADGNLGEVLHCRF